MRLELVWRSIFLPLQVSKPPLHAGPISANPGEDWSEVDILAQMLRLTCRVSGRAFVGTELYRNEEWLDISCKVGCVSDSEYHIRLPLDVSLLGVLVYPGSFHRCPQTTRHPVCPAAPCCRSDTRPSSCIPTQRTRSSLSSANPATT